MGGSQMLSALMRAIIFSLCIDPVHALHLNPHLYPMLTGLKENELRTEVHRSSLTEKVQLHRSS